MGLFGNLFEKKSCSICGGEIGLLGNRKLEDGNLCKSCAAKLSPWMDDRRHTTVSGIREHLNYREANRNALAAFHPTRSAGRDWMVLVDEAAGNFLVTRGNSWRENNCDVIPLRAVSDVQVKVNESKTELKTTRKTPDGKTESISYNPPRYRYSYSFDLRILLNDTFPWFDDIHFSLNNGSITVESVDTTGFAGVRRFAPITVNPHSNPKYTEAEQLGEDIRQALLSCRSFPAPQRGVPAPMVGAAPAEAECAYCGSRFTPDGSGKCPCCGGPLG